jgi:hypothetical protein
MHRRDAKCIQNFLWENLKGREHSEDLGQYEKLILEWILGKRVGGCGQDISGSG